MTAPTLETERLLLRHWKKSDLPLFAALNADPRVMEHFPKALSKQESDELAGKFEEELQEKKYGLWALEIKASSRFIGFAGLHAPDFSAHFTPCIEIGWRLAYDAWGQGYAIEAASKVLEYAFSVLGLEEVVSFTAAVNFRSIKLMRKLGMFHDKEDDFFHPKLPKGHPLGPHVLYRMRKEQYFKVK